MPMYWCAYMGLDILGKSICNSHRLWLKLIKVYHSDCLMQWKSHYHNKCENLWRFAVLSSMHFYGNFMIYIMVAMSKKYIYCCSDDLEINVVINLFTTLVLVLFFFFKSIFIYYVCFTFTVNNKQNVKFHVNWSKY